MASENFLAKDDFGTTQRVKHFTTASGKITYTAKTGRPADDFVIDRVIRVTSTEGYDLTITLPNGVYYGQRCDVLFETRAASGDTVDVSPSTGDSGTQLTGAGGYNRYEWFGSTIGWTLTDSSAT